MNSLPFHLSIALTLAAAPVSAEPEEPHNILLVIADDLGTDMLGIYGEGIDVPSTPNIDALASQGVLFRNAWSSPLCSPSRACIQTGRFGFRTGIGMTVKNRKTYNGLSTAETILPEMLDQGTNHRYQHALFGKWHLNHASRPDLSGAPVGPDVVLRHGYGHHEGVIHNIVAPDSYTSWPKVTNGIESTSTTYATTANVDDFLRWRETAQEPYFAVLAFNAPHTPLHAPPSSLHTLDLAGETSPRPFYKAMVEALDTELGRLLLEIAPTLGRTTVIFISDNGTPGNIIKADPYELFDKGHGKGTAYQSGVNVPFIVTGPAVARRGSESFALVNTVDVFATVAELAGVDLSRLFDDSARRTLDSVSVVPYLREPGLPSRRQINFTEKFFENTVLGARPDEEQISRHHICQANVGFESSDDAPTLSVCGQAIVEKTDNEATLRLEGALPFSRVYLMAGPYGPGANASFGGATTISSTNFPFLKTKPIKIDLSKPHVTDSNGKLVIGGLVHQVDIPQDFYLQAAVWSPQTFEWQISNAVLYNQTINVKAARNLEGYKLLAHISGGPQELYDLVADPKETNNLLAGGVFSLSHDQWTAYESLRKAIGDALNPDLNARFP